MRTALSWEEAAELARVVKQKGGKVVTTNGCFDIIHKGHVTYLQAARSQGDLLLVGINSDASVRAIKGPSRPLNAETDRAIVVSALRSVDGACVFDDETPVAWLRCIRPDIHVKGGDWAASGKKLPEEEALAEWGGRMHFVDYLDGFSTSSLIKKSQGKS